MKTFVQLPPTPLGNCTHVENVGKALYQPFCRKCTRKELFHAEIPLCRTFSQAPET